MYLIAPFIILGCAFLLLSGRFLNALSLGEETANSLGFAINRWSWLIIAGVACAVGASVAFSGSIGFIGLVVPHLLRPLFAYQPSRLLIPSALVGASLLVIADMAVQLIAVHLTATQQELKLGVITALIGAPFFFYLIVKIRRQTF